MCSLFSIRKATAAKKAIVNGSSCCSQAMVRTTAPMAAPDRHEPQADTTPRREQSRINTALTFESFVTGKANQLARAAAIQVANNPGVSYNPLFFMAASAWGRPT